MLWHKKTETRNESQFLYGLINLYGLEAYIGPVSFSNGG